jgi:hypothetical protein
VKLVANVALFQIGWFASVLGAASGYPLVGPAVVGVVLTVHLLRFGTRREAALVAASALLGAAAESALFLTGLVSYRADSPPVWLAPPWIIGMWANFAITLRHSLRWLGSRWLLAAFLGAVAGPLAYVGGERLGAIELLKPLPAILALAALWGLALVGFLGLSRRLSIK